VASLGATIVLRLGPDCANRDDLVTVGAVLLERALVLPRVLMQDRRAKVNVAWEKGLCEI